MDKDVYHHYELESCLDWIIKNKFKRVIVQFKPADIGDSTEVLKHLEYGYRERQGKSLDLYVTQSNTCCVDLIVTQHVSNVDAIIHFGKVCFSKPHLVNQDEGLPILFVLTHVKQDPHVFRSNLGEIVRQIESIIKVRSNCPVCLLYGTNLIDFVENLHDHFDKSFFEAGKLIVPSSNWSTTTRCSDLITDQTNHRMGQFGFSRPVDSFKSVVYLGKDPDINLILQMPSNVWKIDCQSDVIPEKLNVSRVLSKRMALVDRLREDEELKFGVIITNPLPDFGEVSKRLESYAKTRKHILYFITMIQTIDECKIGNFDLCDAFVVINNCTCSMILESLYFNRPIISDIEFKLACGFEDVYGRVLWPKSDYHLSEEDLINKRKVSDISLALVHDRNELLERCSTARTNLWSGLDYKQAAGIDGDGRHSIEEGVEGLSIIEGLHGIASTYKSEPLKPPCDNDH